MNSDKDILSLATMNSTDYVRNQSSALIYFICGVTQVDISKVDTDKKLAFQISVACEQLQKISSPMYVGPASLLQNLNIFAITNSKLALNILGNVVPSGRYNTVFNWLSQQANVPLKCPPGDLVVMFDNEQIVGKTWSIKPNNKVNMSIITNVAAVPLTSNTTLQDRSDLHPRKWLTEADMQKHGEELVGVSEECKTYEYEMSDYEQLYIFFKVTLEEVIKEQQPSHDGDLRDKIDDIVEDRKKQ